MGVVHQYSILPCHLSCHLAGTTNISIGISIVTAVEKRRVMMVVLLLVVEEVEVEEMRAWQQEEGSEEV